ncbi:inhibitor of the pro-sigma K processing machinery [Amphibacillus marinus]|uniref:Inhibitor of the pro-sigma K processing machinery n=1 Tax=Amphibacillus marinus TaxID=872970 RepID=A0A1H8PBQ3_9BACI|nr:pro-sigmaK processing inhibitor BofA family protein [Amphibacillus marinus]SEO39372.1 inhibitor of the pro-sigma K processing machinery [Amphibacillus marinus]
MLQGVIIGGIVIFIVALFSPATIKWLSKLVIKVVIGAILLFFLNLVSGTIGLHIPINLFTSTLVGILGLPGILALSSLQLYVL